MKTTLSVLTLGLAVSAATVEAGFQDWRPYSLGRSAAIVQAAALARPVEPQPLSAPIESVVDGLSRFSQKYAALAAAADFHAAMLQEGYKVCPPPSAPATSDAYVSAARPPRLAPPSESRFGHTECGDVSGPGASDPFVGIASDNIVNLPTVKISPAEMLATIWHQWNGEIKPQAFESSLIDMLSAAARHEQRIRGELLRFVGESSYRFEQNPFEKLEVNSDPAPTAFATSPITARGLLNEYHAYDMTLNDRLWLSQTRSTVCTPVEQGRIASNLAPANPAPQQRIPGAEQASLGFYVSQSNAACSPGASGAGMSKAAQSPAPGRDVATSPVYGYVIARLPVEQSLTTKNQAVSSDAMTFLSAGPETLFGRNVAPSLDLHLAGLAGIEQECRLAWRDRRSDWLNAARRAAVEEAPSVPHGIITSTAGAAELDAPVRGAAVLRAAAAASLERLSETLSIAQAYIDGAAASIAGNSPSRVAGRQANQR